MHLVLTGATGLVGSAALDAMIKNPGITKISILSRRPVKMAEDSKDPRINFLIHKDFGQYDSELLSKLQGASGCVWALGISQTQVGKEEYVKITKDYALAASQAFKELATEQQPFNFVYVSGEGANTKPTRFSQIFARVKGETELSLAEIRKANPFFHASSVRPAYVDASTHDAIKPYLPKNGLLWRAAEGALGPVVRCAVQSAWSPTQDLGKFLTEMAMGQYKDQFKAKDIQMEGEFPILANTAFRRLAGLSRT